MGDLEKYLHTGHTLVLAKAALAHVQFETIHPFRTETADWGGC
jgi:Fic family protein